MLDSDEFLSWSIIALLVVLVTGLLAIGIYVVVDAFQEGAAQERCGHLGGKVEHYDAEHKSYWRCVGARAEAD